MHVKDHIGTSLRDFLICLGGGLWAERVQGFRVHGLGFGAWMGWFDICIGLGLKSYLQIQGDQVRILDNPL